MIIEQVLPRRGWVDSVVTASSHRHTNCFMRPRGQRADAEKCPVRLTQQARFAQNPPTNFSILRAK